MSHSALATGKDLLTKIIEEIENNNNIHLISLVKSLTDLLYNNQYLIYSEINDEIEKFGFVTLLLNSLYNLQPQYKRDILRLLNLFLKINKNLRKEARQNVGFMKYLSDMLEHNELMVHPDRYKYQIHVAATLLLDDDDDNNKGDDSLETMGMDEYNSNSTQMNSYESRTHSFCERMKSRQLNSDHLPLLVLHACAMRPRKYSTLSTNITDTSDVAADGNFLTKEKLGSFNDHIRDYIMEFRKFYKIQKNKNYIFYFPKYEFTFDQICWTIGHLAKSSKMLRMNLYQSGFYEIVSNAFIIDWVPNDIIMTSLMMLKIPTIDESVKNDFKRNFPRIFERLSRVYDNINYDSKVKDFINHIRELFNIQIPNTNNNNNNNNNNTASADNNCLVVSGKSSPPIITGLPGAQQMQNNGQGFMPFISIGKWGRLDIDVWLSENGLDSMRDSFKNMTGRGFRQMMKILAENNGRSKLLQLLTEKGEIDLVTSLEFIGALEEMV